MTENANVVVVVKQVMRDKAAQNRKLISKGKGYTDRRMRKGQDVDCDRDPRGIERGSRKHERRRSGRHVEGLKGGEICHTLKWSRKGRKGRKVNVNSSN